ncbi:hypothetical protein CC79DRAFT_1132883 [Sarocladium strictum]
MCRHSTYATRSSPSAYTADGPARSLMSISIEPYTDLLRLIISILSETEIPMICVCAWSVVYAQKRGGDVSLGVGSGFIGNLARRRVPTTAVLKHHHQPVQRCINQMKAQVVKAKSNVMKLSEVRIEIVAVVDRGTPPRILHTTFTGGGASLRPSNSNQPIFPRLPLPPLRRQTITNLVPSHASPCMRPATKDESITKPTS